MIIKTAHIWIYSVSHCWLIPGFRLLLEDMKEVSRIKRTTWTCNIHYRELSYRDMNKLILVRSGFPEHLYQCTHFSMRLMRPESILKSVTVYLWALGTRHGTHTRRNKHSVTHTSVFCGFIPVFQFRRDMIKAIPLLVISIPPFAIGLVFILMWVLGKLSGRSYLSQYWVMFISLL